MENTFAFITNEYKTQHFSFRIIHAGSAFLFPNFISPDGLTKKAEKKKCRFRMMGIACSVNLRRA